MYKNVHKLATAAMILVIATAAFGQSEMRTNEMSKKAQTVVTVREGQSIKFTVDDPNKTGVITVTNPTDLVGDADLVAKDKDNVEIVRESVEIEPNANTPVTIQKVFPDLDLAGVSVDIGVSLRARSVDVS